MASSILNIPFGIGDNISCIHAIRYHVLLLTMRTLFITRNKYLIETVPHDNPN